jgi:hypothetical protein
VSTGAPSDTPKLYAEFASWFHLLTAPEDYAEEAKLYAGLLSAAADDPVIAFSSSEAAEATTLPT